MNSGGNQQQQKLVRWQDFIFFNFRSHHEQKKKIKRRAVVGFCRGSGGVPDRASRRPGASRRMSKARRRRVRDCVAARRRPTRCRARRRRDVRRRARVVSGGACAGCGCAQASARRERLCGGGCGRRWYGRAWWWCGEQWWSAAWTGAEWRMLALTCVF